MDPATVFLLYFVGTLSMWLLGTAIRPALQTVSHLAIALPIGRRLAAIMISAALVGSVGMAKASVGPPSERMTQMTNATQRVATNNASVVHWPAIASAGSSYAVVSGDSLWKIARTILSTEGAAFDGSTISELWRAIYDTNRETIGPNPNLIHPGQVLDIPGR
jgi:nucleoid-associated protein YgaU